jgi:hypothetical protein
MRLCSYVVTHDTGFVPNPFWGFCTCAACTPNHKGLRLEPGDWLLGNSSADRGAERQLIYAMRLSEPAMDFDEYYRDPRFRSKKARDKSWKGRCGDNIYYRDDTQRWKQARAFHHTTPEDKKRDTRYPRVFISDYFFYFGENAPVLDKQFASLVRIGRGCEYHYDETVLAFVKWLERRYRPGLHGLPRDREEDTDAECGHSTGETRCSS